MGEVPGGGPAGRDLGAAGELLRAVPLLFLPRPADDQPACAQALATGCTNN